MLRSIDSGASGLRAHEQMMDVIGNNIANVNTTGFKSSSIQFADALSQQVSAGGGPAGSAGGTNGAQIGLGVKVAGTARNMTAGSTQVTGRTGDVAIQGEGFFQVKDASGAAEYTRAGSFNFDAAGNLVDPSGAVVQGWLADASGKITTSAPVGNVKVGVGTAFPPVATSNVTVGGNLSADAAVGTTVNTSIDVYDSLGAAHSVGVSYTKTADNTWTQQVADPSGAALTPASVTLSFDPSTGALASATPAPTYGYTPAGGAAPMSFSVGFGTAGQAGALTQFGGDTTAAALSQDGAASGSLRSLAIGDGGVISGTFSNGQTRNLGQIALATFSNPAGLTDAGDNHFTANAASGTASVGVPGSGGRGSLAAGALEGSNVDLSKEFTDLIVAQRGFQANARVITTGDEMLQDLTQLKR